MADRLRALSLNIQRARFARTSPAALILSSQLSSSSDKIACALLTACGANLPHTDGNNVAWVMMQSLGPLAELMSREWVNSARGRTDSQRMAYMFGQLTSTWMIEDHTLPATAEARRYIQETCLMNPPNMDSINHVGRYAIDIFNKEKNELVQVPADTFRSQLYIPNNMNPPINIPPMVNRMFLRLWERNLHNLSIDIFDGDFATLLGQVRNLDVDPLPIPDNLVVTVSPHLVANWINLNVDYKLAFYEILGMARHDHYNAHVASASFVALAVLIKQGNLTDAWLEKRVDRLSKELQSLDLTGMITTDIIGHFNVMFPVSQMTPDEVYYGVMAQYTLWDSLRIESIKWILEQSILHNTASANALSSVIMKTKSLNIDLLLIQVPTIEFTNLCTLVGNAIYDRFCTIIKPPVTVREYADLAFIGIVIAFKRLEPSKTQNQFAGKPDMMASLPYEQLIDIAAKISEISSAIEADTINAVSIAKDFLHDYTIIDGQNRDVFLIPKSSQPACPNVQQWSDYVSTALNRRQIVQGAGDLFTGIQSHYFRKQQNLAQAKVRGEAQNVIDDLTRELEDLEEQVTLERRSQWGRKFQTLPLTANRMTHLGLHQMLLNNQSTMAQAFRNLMIEFHNLGLQRPLAILEGDRINPDQRRYKLSDQVLADLTTMRVTIPDEWRRDPVPVAPIHALNIDFSHYFLLFRYIQGPPAPILNPIIVNPLVNIPHAPPGNAVDVTEIDIAQILTQRMVNQAIDVGTLFATNVRLSPTFVQHNYTGMNSYDNMNPRQTRMLQSLVRYVTDHNIERDVAQQLPQTQIRGYLVSTYLCRNYPSPPYRSIKLSALATDQNLVAPARGAWSWSHFVSLPSTLLTANEITLKQALTLFINDNWAIDANSIALTDDLVFEALSLQVGEMINQLQLLGYNVPMNTTAQDGAYDWVWS
nr:MAG: nucleoprotein [Beetle aliusvirus]